MECSLVVHAKRLICFGANYFLPPTEENFRLAFTCQMTAPSQTRLSPNSLIRRQFTSRVAILLAWRHPSPDKSDDRKLTHYRELSAVRFVIKGARPPALDARGSSSAAGQSEAKNGPPFAENKIAKGRPPGKHRLFGCATRRVDSVFGLFLLTAEPRTGGGATAGKGYVVVGIENLDC